MSDFREPPAPKNWNWNWKAVGLKDGTFGTWDTGEPHAVYLISNEIPIDSVETFWAIGTQGRWENLNRYLDTYHEIYERLTKEPDEWGFESKTAGVEVHHGQTTSEDSYFEIHDGPGSSHSRPIIWDNKNENLYVGQHGTHHTDVIDEFGLHNPDEPFDPYDYTSDAFPHGKSDLNYGRIDPSAIDENNFGLSEWGNRPISRHPGARKALEGLGVTMHNFEDDWSFSKVADMWDLDDHDDPNEAAKDFFGESDDIKFVYSIQFDDLAWENAWSELREDPEAPGEHHDGLALKIQDRHPKMDNEFVQTNYNFVAGWVDPRSNEVKSYQEQRDPKIEAHTPRILELLKEQGAFQHFSKVASDLKINHNYDGSDWGGKGIIHDGTLHTWNVDKGGSPHHFEYLSNLLEGTPLWQGDTEQPGRDYGKQFDKYYGESMRCTPFFIRRGEVDPKMNDMSPEHNAIVQSLVDQHRTDDEEEDDWSFNTSKTAVLNDEMEQLARDFAGPPSKPIKPPAERTDEEWRQRWNEGFDMGLQGKKDVDRYPEVEWVPVENLRALGEWKRRPGEAEGADPQYYEDLKSHITQHGVHTPLQVFYNPETQLAHLAEGNHRVPVAEDLGMTHLPAFVQKSRRPSDAATYMPKGPAGDSGRYMKPSAIGLPARQTKVATGPIQIVSVNKQEADARAIGENSPYPDLLSLIWIPDQNTIYLGNEWAHHHHIYQFISGLGLARSAMYEGLFYVREKELEWVNEYPGDKNEKLIKDALLEHLELEPSMDWTLSKTAGTSNWTEGSYGKGALVGGTDLHTWNTEMKDGSPTHYEYLKKNLGMGIGQYSKPGAFVPFWISVSGEIGGLPPDDRLAMWGGRKGLIEAIQKIDPRLTIPDGGWARIDDTGFDPGSWSFDSRVADRYEDASDEELSQIPELSDKDIKAIVARGYQGGEGKALTYGDDNRVDWTVNDWGGPHHFEVASVLRITPSHEILIAEDGTETNMGLEFGNPDPWGFDDGTYSRVIPSHTWKPNAWEFKAFTGDDDQLYWESGKEGKGLIDGENNVHTWSTEDGHPWHNEYLTQHQIDAVLQYFFIDDDGTIHDGSGFSIDAGYLQRIFEAEPLLRTEEQGTWGFS